MISMIELFNIVLVLVLTTRIFSFQVQTSESVEKMNPIRYFVAMERVVLAACRLCFAQFFEIKFAELTGPANQSEEYSNIFANM